MQKAVGFLEKAAQDVRPGGHTRTGEQRLQVRPHRCAADARPIPRSARPADAGQCPAIGASRTPPTRRADAATPQNQKDAPGQTLSMTELRGAMPLPSPPTISGTRKSATGNRGYSVEEMVKANGPVEQVSGDGFAALFAASPDLFRRAAQLKGAPLHRPKFGSPLVWDGGGRRRALSNWYQTPL